MACGSVNASWGAASVSASLSRVARRRDHPLLDSTGPFQNGSIGYWIDEELAGSGFTPEAVVVVLQFAFETLRLHRIEVAIIPRNMASRRVVEKLDLRSEGVALG